MNAVERAAEVVQCVLNAQDDALHPPLAVNIAEALADAGLLVTDEWVHISNARFTSEDMFAAWSAGFQWCADRVEANGVDAEYVPYDIPGAESCDHTEAFGSWLDDYDADTGRVNDDGEYRRPELVTDEMRAVIDAAVAVTTAWDWNADDEFGLLAAVDVYLLAAGADR